MQFFERDWHNLQIQDYLSLLKIFKELGRRYFVDLLLPDKEKSVYDSIASQRITYSPFVRQETGLVYRLIVNVPIYFVDTSVSMAGYTMSEDSIGFGKDVVFNAAMFTDANVDTVETGSIINLYSVDTDTEQLIELIHLFAENNDEALAYYQTHIVKQDALFEVVSVNRFTLASDIGFIWQLQLKKTEKRIDFDNVDVSDVFVYDAYTNSIQTAEEFLVLFYVHNVLRVITQVISLAQQVMANYRYGFLLPYDMYTLSDVFLFARQQKYESLAKDMGLMLLTQYKPITDAYSKYTGDNLLNLIHESHFMYLYFDAVANNKDIDSLLVKFGSTDNVETELKALLYNSKNFATNYKSHVFLYAGLEDPYVQALSIDRFASDLLRRVGLNERHSKLWYKLHKAIVNTEFALAKDVYQTINNQFKTVLAGDSSIKDVFVSDTDFSLRFDLQLLIPLLIDYVSKRISW